MQPAKPITFETEEEALLTECKRVSPSALGVLNHGRANFATTYSTSFSEVVADLLRLYGKASIPDPVRRLSQQFIAHGIESCRGAAMTDLRVRYLLDHHVSRLGIANKYRVLDRLVGVQCPYCGKWKRGLSTHVKAAHRGQAAVAPK